MNWYEIALGVVLIAVSLLIIVFTLAQEQKGQGRLPPSWVITPLWLPAVSVASMQSWLS